MRTARRGIATAVGLVLLVLPAATACGGGADSDLEARVAALEEQVAVLNGLVATSSSTQPDAELRSLTGTLTLQSTAANLTVGQNDACWGVRGNADITEGTEVVVRDAGTGGIVGLGYLGPGTIAGMTGDTQDCEFSFSVLDLPVGLSFIQVEVGQDRGEARYTAEQLAELGWHIELTLG